MLLESNLSSGVVLAREITIWSSNNASDPWGLAHADEPLDCDTWPGPLDQWDTIF